MAKKALFFTALTLTLLVMLKVNQTSAECCRPNVSPYKQLTYEPYYYSCADGKAGTPCCANAADDCGPQCCGCRSGCRKEGDDW